MDWNKLVTNQRFKQTKEQESFKYYTEYTVSQFETDYQTIINSAAFRRLQDKTQVFPLETNDFVRTRLTHSIETSFIAKKLGNMVLYNMQRKRKKESFANKAFSQNEDELLLIPDILACTGLLHDMGNPPFGHFGEVIIGEWFKENLSHLHIGDKYLYNKDGNSFLTEEEYDDLCHFEGNAQLLRVICRLYNGQSHYGMNLTNAVLASLIKYPISSSEIKKGNYKKFGYFQADKEIFNQIIQNTGLQKEDTVSRHPLVYLLEAADDIAYLTADIEDALKKGTLLFDQFRRFYQEEINKYKNELKSYDDSKIKYVLELANIIINCNEENIDICIKTWLNETRNSLMYCAAYKFVDEYYSIINGTYKKDLFDGTFQEKTVDILKRIAQKYIFPDKKIVKVEISGSMILTSLLRKFVPAIMKYDCKDYKISKENQKIVNLLPDNYIKVYKDEVSKLSGDDIEDRKMYLRLLLVTDFISGMTDSYAKRLYFELYGLE